MTTLFNKRCCCVNYSNHF